MRRLALAAAFVVTAFSPSAPQEPDSVPAAATAIPPAGAPSVAVAASVSPAAHSPTPVILPTGLLTPDVEAKLSSGFLETMKLVYQGRIVEAAARAEELVALAPEDPRPYILKARVMREHVSEQDNVREHVKPQIDPILGLLDTAKEKSDAILEKNPESIPGYLYRGWAKLFKGQLHELAFEHWSAGRSAKSGKGDLDKVLASDPNNPDALMIAGTYLYFADLLPGVLKIASFVLRIPGGDRTEGLEYLQRSEGIPSYSQLDAKGMRGAILFAFEGKLDDASNVFDTLDDEFPDNPRLVEPLAMLDIWFVERTGKGLSRISRVVDKNESGSDPYARALAERLRLYESYMQILTGRVDDGRTSLERLHREKSEGGPDWFRPVVDLYLTDVNLLLGDRNAVVALQADAAKDDDLKKLLRYASAEGAEAGKPDVETFRRLQPVAESLYSGRLEEAEAGLGGLPEKDPLVDFYRGELLHLRGQQREALAHYQRLLAPTVPARCRLFARVARLRIAEIQASFGEWQAAAETFDDEIEKYDVKDMWRHVARARQRYFLKQAGAVRG